MKVYRNEGRTKKILVHERHLYTKNSSHYHQNPGMENDSLSFQTKVKVISSANKSGFGSSFNNRTAGKALVCQLNKNFNRTVHSLFTENERDLKRCRVRELQSAKAMNSDSRDGEPIKTLVKKEDLESRASLTVSTQSQQSLSKYRLLSQNLSLPLFLVKLQELNNFYDQLSHSCLPFFLTGETDQQSITIKLLATLLQQKSMQYSTRNT